MTDEPRPVMVISESTERELAQYAEPAVPLHQVEVWVEGRVRRFRGTRADGTDHPDQDLIDWLSYYAAQLGLTVLWRDAAEDGSFTSSRYRRFSAKRVCTHDVAMEIMTAPLTIPELAHHFYKEEITSQVRKTNAEQKISNHIVYLRRAGLIDQHRDNGRWRYSLRVKTQEDYIKHMRQLGLDPRLGRGD